MTEPCPDCNVVPTPYTNSPWVIHCENCEWDDTPVPCLGLGLSKAAAIAEWNRDAKNRAAELESGDAVRCTQMKNGGRQAEHLTTPKTPASYA